jgi:Cof subfamily protein (haloacid dehalogenase superfamily)
MQEIIINNKTETTTTTTTAMASCLLQQEKANMEQPAAAASSSSPQFQAIALDLDGTLLNSNHEISKASADYLRHLHAKGIPILFATGRAGPTVMKHVIRLQIDKLPVVCSNGARGLQCTPIDKRSVHVKELFSMPVPLEITKRVIQLADKLGQMVQYYHGTSVYANASKAHHYKLAKRYSALTGCNTIYMQDSFESLLTASKLSSKLLVLCPEHKLSEVLTAFQQEFKDEATIIYGATSSTTKRRGGWFLEILHPQVNKGTGLQTMCALLNISVDDVVAFGDGENDVEFLSVAGKGIAMKNARETAKKVADQVIPYTNNEVCS